MSVAAVTVGTAKIPSEWQMVPLGEIATVIDGDRGTNYPQATDFRDDGFCLFLNAGNVTAEGFRFTACAFITEQKDALLHKGKLLRDDAVLTTRGTVGNVAYFHGGITYENIRINSGMVILRPDKSVVHPPYFYVMLRSGIIQSQIERLRFGSAQPQLTVKGIATFSALLPPIHEQEAIAAALSDVDALIGALDKLIAKERAIKLATMQQLLLGKRRLTGFRETRLRDVLKVGVIPIDWNVAELRQTATMHGRIGWQGLKESEFTSNSDDPFLITGMNFKDGEIRWNEVYHVSASRYAMAPEIQLRSGDVLMTKDGTIGKLLFVNSIPHPGLATLNSHLLVFRPKNDSFDPLFLYYQFSSKRFAEHIDLHKSGSTFFGLTQTAAGKYLMILPSLDEQRAISSVLSDMDAEIAALERRRDKTKTIKQGMMQQLLTGRIRLVKPEAAQ